MRQLFTLTSLVAVLMTGFQTPVLAQRPAAATLQAQVEGTYSQWRDAMIRKDLRRWQAHTSQRRQTVVRNQIYSERRGFPAALFWP